MIVSRRPQGLVLVRQVDHQEQCGLMARAWGGGGFALPDHAEALVTAARLHDEGWREWEAAPRAHDGRPVDFTEIDRSEHVDLYRRGIDEVRRRDPLAGLLVSLHGQGLYEARRGLDPGEPTPRAQRAPHVRKFLEEQDRVQDELRAAIGERAPSPEWEWAAYRLLQAWDSLSLYLTWRALPAGRAGGLPRVPREVGDPGVDLELRPDGESGCTIRPWPFGADRVALPITARAIPDRRYAGDDDLRAAFEAAVPFTLELSARPA